MPGDSKTTLSFLTGEAILAGAFDRLRPRLLAMIGRRIGSKLAMRIDPEGTVIPGRLSVTHPGSPILTVTR